MPGRRHKRSERSKLDATPPWETRVRDAPETTVGPFDERDAPDDDIERVDLGALLIPMYEGVELRVDVDENQQVASATLVTEHGTMQLGVFAAPRNEGIWDEVRAEIAESLNAQRRSSATEQDGELSVELIGAIPAEGSRETIPVRFVGVDGPRWFLRAMFAGDVAQDAARAEVLERALRQVIVVRGNDPLPVREPVALKLPEGVEAPGEPA